MKYLSLVVLIFIFTTSFGQVTSDDLPKPVVKELNSLYKKQEVTLKAVNQDAPESSSDRFYTILTDDSPEPKGYLHIGKVNTCRAGGCSAPGENSSADSKSEYFDYLIIFNTALAVETIKVFNYQASYGHEIASRGWLKQFQGFKGEKSLEPGKDIDVISGATVSVYAITADLEWKTKQLQEMIQ